jgi:hypothetical protein
VDLISGFLAWFGTLKGDDIRTTGTIVAVLISLAALIEGRRTEENEKKAQENERRQNHAEIDRLLHDAWLTLGGDLGSSTI